eukprot:COSAG06_NODE_304_length_17855_cov_47.399414_9_plen_58_part_00
MHLLIATRALALSCMHQPQGGALGAVLLAIHAAAEAAAGGSRAISSSRVPWLVSVTH